MPTTAEHARSAIEILRSRMRFDGVISPIDFVDFARFSGYQPSHYAKAYGQAVSLLDATCLTEGLPWVGRLLQFSKKHSDVQGPWAIWDQHMPEILAASRTKRWSVGELQHISKSLRTGSADN